MGVPAKISAFKTGRKATGEHCLTAYYSYVSRRRRDKYGRFGQGFSIGHAGYASFFTPAYMVCTYTSRLPPLSTAITVILLPSILLTNSAAGLLL